MQSELFDPGLIALVNIAKLHNIPIEISQLQHQFSRENDVFNDNDILRAAKATGFKAEKQTPELVKLDNHILPAIAKARDGSYFILAKTNQDEENGTTRFLVQRIAEQHTPPEVLEEGDFQSLWSGEVLLLRPKSRNSWLKHDEFNISWFIPSLRKYKKLFIEVIWASLFIQLFALVTPLFFQVVMDKVLVHKGYSTLDVLAIGFFAIALFDVVLGGLRNYVFSHSTNRVDVELGAKLYNHLLALPLSYFKARAVGQNVARVRELDTIRNFITGSALTLLIDLSFTVIFFAVLWWYSPTLTWVVLATIPLYILLSLFITPILRHRLNNKFKYGAENQAFLVESVTGVETVKSQAVEPQFQRKWEDQLAKYVHASFRAQNLGNISNQIASFISKLTTLGIVWIGAHLVMKGDLSVGQLVAFNMIAGRVNEPILKLVGLWQEFQQAGISLKRLGDILNSPCEPGFNPNRSTLPSIQGKVTFENVNFRYDPEGQRVLHSLELQVNPGEVLGIVGRSGSGKSTLTKLIQRLHVPESGRVLVDGVDLSMVDTAWLRRNVGVVLQENFLFNRTVRENIALSNPGLPMEQVVEAAKLAGAHEFILELPNGYDSMVGEQGANLSGGQRQRLAIARALMNNPRILIFDEATSALDYESERIIQENMARICYNRTVFIIAHRLSTVRGTDRIVVMDKGVIVEQGNHEQLLKQQGYYAKLNGFQNHVPPIRPIKPLNPLAQSKPIPATKKASKQGASVINTVPHESASEHNGKPAMPSSAIATSEVVEK
ncbi:type I secretion system permease/ATPase [Flocculibacter collagenilyticus]|uniref:type I secretion system permease/ATPase n=1 Tax=Flocculibacter collagenilyticus TaxID=2744479 RepID=UPI0018F536BD|nr:type I secretion system permease/ATPase [Flocculibacter collagenilyticus]